MTEAQLPKLEGRFNWNAPKIITSFVQGDEALAIYQHVTDLGLGNVWYDERSKTMKGSNPFISARIDTLGREAGFRVTTPYDLSQPEVMQMIKGRFYSDAPAFVVRSERDSNSTNQGLLNQIISLAEEKQGKARFPFLVQGFDCQKPYEIIPRDDFQIIEDERLSMHGKKFNEVDENGIPIFDKKGNRTFWARDDGLSRLCSYDDLDLGSANDSLSSSYDGGRVVLVSGEASAQNFEAQLRGQYEQQQNALKERFEKAQEVLRGKL